MTYKLTPIIYSLHADWDNPIFGNSVTTIEICDEAGGTFIELRQNHDTSTGKLRFDWDEFEYLTTQLKQLRKTHE
jgi:hypothetical protein